MGRRKPSLSLSPSLPLVLHLPPPPPPLPHSPTRSRNCRHSLTHSPTSELEGLLPLACPPFRSYDSHMKHYLTSTCTCATSSSSAAQKQLQLTLKISRTIDAEMLQ